MCMATGMTRHATHASNQRAFNGRHMYHHVKQLFVQLMDDALLTDNAPPPPPPPVPAPPHLARPGTVSLKDRLSPAPRMKFWNTWPCRNGRRCSDRRCTNYHANSESRCLAFAAGTCLFGNNCIVGLHIKSGQVRYTFSMDMDNWDAVRAEVNSLDTLSTHTKAFYIALHIWNADWTCIREQNRIKAVMTRFPMLHDIILPGCPQAIKPGCQELLRIIRSMWQQSWNPRLHWIVFQDGEFIPIRPDADSNRTIQTSSETIWV